MELMRDQKPSGGLIQQVTSISGQRGYAVLPNRDGASANQCGVEFRPSLSTVQASRLYKFSRKLFPTKSEPM